jgi:hypothetical protein
LSNNNNITTLPNYEERLQHFTALGTTLRSLASGEDPGDGLLEEFRTVCSKATAANPWFDEQSLNFALEAISDQLTLDNLSDWLKPYPYQETPSVVGVIMPGNIPAAGFHDLLSVVLSGNILKAKMSREDSELIPFFKGILTRSDPRYEVIINFVDRISDVDAVIATGSNNTFRYFDHYFSKHPHIFRKNRNSVAVITGTENEYDYLLLGRDIFTYYGLGCRNISKLYVPREFQPDELFRNIEKYSHVMEHNKYMNNYEYQRAILVMNQVPFLTNNFLILREAPSLMSPVSVLHYEYYDDAMHLGSLLQDHQDDIQCIVSKTEGSDWVMPGHAQMPELSDYADNVDTMDFLTGLNSDQRNS